MAVQGFKRILRFALGTGAAALLLAPGAAAETATPLPASEYGTAPVCRQAAPGRATCLSRRLVARSTRAKSHRHPLAIASAKVLGGPSAGSGDFGLRPSDLHNAYALPGETGGHPLVAVVDAYNAPTLEADLAAYSREFHLPSCTAGNGCLQILGEHGTGELPFPHSTGELNSWLKGSAQQRNTAEAALSWGIEISLDVETVHAVCPACRITLVAASSEDNESLFNAERAAEALNPASITNSWGSIEEGGTADELAPFNDPHTVITAAAGDEGYLSWYHSFEVCEANRELSGNCRLEYSEAPYFPASSPDVVSVGGTRLQVSASGQREQESVWNGQGAGGSGCSTVFEAPAWQQETGDWNSVGCGGKRAVADVSAVGDPYTGLAVYNSTSYCETRYPNESGRTEVQHWCTIGGTSLSSPLIAAAYALAGGNNGAEYPARYLYENERSNPGSLHDVTRGSNGGCNFAMNGEEGVAGCETRYESQACEGHAICTAVGGYDGPSGVGTPNGLAALRPVGAPVLHGPNISGRVVIRRISLTARAARSLRRGSPRSLSFSVRVSGAGRVTVRLYKRVRRGRRMAWVAVGRAHSVSLRSGSNMLRVATGTMRRGSYRLVLSPAHGSARSTQFSKA